MIHGGVLFLFITIIATILFQYGYLKYAVITSVLFLPFIVFKLIFHIKNTLRTIVFGLFVCIMCYVYIGNTIDTFEQKYQNAFIFEDTNLLFEGTIDEFPSYRFENNQYILRIKNSTTRILFFTHPYQKYSYNQIVSVSGKLLDVRDQDSQWDMYYKRLGVQYVVFNPQIEESSFDDEDTLGILIKQKLFYTKNYMRTISLERFSSRASALVLGMLLGEKNELSKEEKELFTQAGLSHILVVSGYNISLLISFVFLLFRPVNKYIRIASALILIFLFVVLVGTDGSVVRAALMGSIIIFAKISNRSSGAVNVLYLVAIMMLFYNPLLLFDIGLHLSFIATYSLLIMPHSKNIPEFVLTTVWVFMFVSLYIIYLSDYISFGNIVSNISVVFLLPLFMFCALISLLFALIHVNLGIDIFMLESMSRYIFFVSNMTQYIPRFEFTITPPVTVVLYSLVCNVLIILKNRYTTLEFIEKNYQKFVPQKPN